MSLFENESAQNFLYENEFDLQEDKHVSGTHLKVNGFARRVVLTQRRKATQKWPITFEHSSENHSNIQK